jgi:hypothetical protein
VEQHRAAGFYAFFMHPRRFLMRALCAKAHRVVRSEGDTTMDFLFLGLLALLCGFAAAYLRLCAKLEAHR